MTDRSRNQAETRRKLSSALARVFAVWRTGLPRPVLVLQAGNALNYFGTGLILPFEIIYLHAVRGFSTATAGLVLATVMGTAAAVTLPSGALLRRVTQGQLVERRRCDGAHRSRVPSPRRPHSRPTSRNSATSCFGAGGCMSPTEEVHA
jgi:hypothetical protein